jgi:hypothetical protein
MGRLERLRVLPRRSLCLCLSRRRRVTRRVGWARSARRLTLMPTGSRGLGCPCILVLGRGAAPTRTFEDPQAVLAFSTGAEKFRQRDACRPQVEGEAVVCRWREEKFRRSIRSETVSSPWHVPTDPVPTEQLIAPSSSPSPRLAPSQAVPKSMRTGTPSNPNMILAGLISLCATAFR